MRTLRIATRGSDLALWQARYVAGRLERERGCKTELLPLKTRGDRLVGSLARVGGKGLFVKEIEQALLDGRADLAVHSGKDLPASVREDLPIVAIPPRADPRDALCGRRPSETLSGLRRGARVGTGSVRRRAQLLRQRPDLAIVPLRGNVPTRLAKLEGDGLDAELEDDGLDAELEDDGLDAVVLAAAGLVRLGLSHRIGERLSPERVLPAVAQGSLAIQARRGDEVARELAALAHPNSGLCFEAERAFLAELGGDCNVPIACLAELIPAGLVRLRGLVISPDASRVAEASLSAQPAQAGAAGREAAQRVLSAGGDAILAAARAELV